MESKKNSSKKTTKTNTKKINKTTSKTETKKVTKEPVKTNTKTTPHKKTSKTNVTQTRKKDIKLPILLITITLILIIIIVLLTKNNDNWVQKGNIISKGNESYEIGDYYDYDESNNGNITGLTDVKWKVLGVDDNGNLLIVSASSIGNVTLGDEANIEKAQQAYLEGSQKVNDFTKNYGKGKGAIAVRSFTNDDLFKLSNYTSEDNKEEYTYYWTGEQEPLSINTSDNNEFQIKHQYNNTFIWYDENTKTWNNTLKTNDATNENRIKITTAKNTLNTLSNLIYHTDEYRLAIDSKAFNMVYLNDDGNRETYWTDNTFVNATNSYISYGQNVVLYDGINYRVFLYSSGHTREVTAGVRAVVTID